MHLVDPEGGEQLAGQFGVNLRGLP